MGRVRFAHAAAILMALAAPCAPALEPADARPVQIRPKFDPLPDALRELTVRLHQTPQPTISVRNPTGKKLVIKDHAKRPFLRIGPTQVAADVDNAWFQRARYPEQTGGPDNSGGSAEWQTIARGNAFDWRDPRLRVRTSVALPPGVTHGASKFLERFRIPVTLGDKTSHISGYFLYQPSPKGIHRAVVADHGDVGGAVSVKPLLGPEPGLFIRNAGQQRLTIRGIEDEPFLRFEPDRVLVNAASATWQQAAPEDTDVPYDEDADRRWVRIAPTGAFGWHDPRVDAGDQEPASGEISPVQAWSVPVTIDDERYNIQGNTWWLPQVTAGLR